MTEEKIFQVSEFNEFISTYIAQVGEVVVEGEISKLSINQGKWIFITIKDEDASVGVFGMTFKTEGYDLVEEGMKVLIYGSPSLYPKSGEFRLNARKIVPAGEGALRIAFEKLKEKLEKEGLFDIARKRSLTSFPEHIGLITAKDSEAYGDFVKVLKHRMGGLKIYFYPVAVQGRNSVSTIHQAFRYLNANYPKLDLLVLTRGGGSLEDLQSFNDEQVARAIFSSKIPVVCGIGHEGNVSIADMVADLHASTPSNAAELVVKDKREVLKEVFFNLKNIDRQLHELIKEKNQMILRNVNTMKHSIGRELTQLRSTIGSFSKQFALFEKRVAVEIKDTRYIRQRLLRVVDQWIEQYRKTLQSLMRLLRSLDFREVLKRGFSITVDGSGAILKSVKGLKRGSVIKTTLPDGKIGSEILNVTGK